MNRKVIITLITLLQTSMHAQKTDIGNWFIYFGNQKWFLPDDYQIQFLYFLALNTPINNKIMKKKTLYGSVYDETLLNG